MVGEWNCNNKCGFNCCSELFITLENDEMKNHFLTYRSLMMPRGYQYYRWLSFHKGVKLDNSTKIVQFHSQLDFKILYHDILKKEILWLDSSCKYLLKNNKCKIFRARPQLCKDAKCPISTPFKKDRWYGHNGKLQKYMEQNL